MGAKFNILYIHGYAGSADSERSKFIKEFLPDSCRVYAPSIPTHCEKALKFVKNYILDRDIDMIVASSLGGFIALSIGLNMYKIVINPVLHPTKLLPEIGANDDIAGTYKCAEGRDVTDVEYNKTYGIFSDNDTVVNCKDEFSKLYKNVIEIVGEHQASKENIRDVVVPLIKKLLKLDD